MRYLAIAFVCIGSLFAEQWIDSQYLLWFIRENPLPSELLTTGSYADALPGALGQPNTHVVLGKDPAGMGWINGFRIEVGSDLGYESGVEGSYFLLPSVRKKRSFFTSGQPESLNYAVPIFDVSGVCGLSGAPGETTFILPGPLDGDPGFFGQFYYRISSLLQGAELNGLFKWMQLDKFRMDGCAGLFWADLHENSTFTANTGTVSNFAFSPGFFRFSDRFITTNHYLAAQLGLKMTYLTEKWRVKGKVKGTAGTNCQTLKIEGKSETPSGSEWFTTVGTGNEILPGGVFAEPSNIGRHRKFRFAGGFNGELQAGFRFNRHLEVEVGYTFLWIWKVLRPGKQIDRKINSTTTALADASRATTGVGSGPISFGSPGPAPAPRGSSRPKILFRPSSFWAQGLNAGIQGRF